MGWSLNPGAISRNVNGYPDDWSSGAGAGGTSSFYWSGGSQTSYSIGVSVGFVGSPASVNFGLSFSEDTYKGFGVGVEAGVGLNLCSNNAGAFKLGVNVGISAYGDGYAGANVSNTYNSGSQVLAASSSLGVQTNFKTTSAGFSAGISSSSESILGASIGTGSMKPSFTVGGGSSTSVNNSNAGKISSETDPEGISIPITNLLSVNLGYSITRYWSATTAGFVANGVLNNRLTLSGDFTNTDDDNYSILDPINSNTIDDPLTVTGGTFPNFDDYNVTAQGLGGSIRPYIFNSELFNQSRVNSLNHGNDVIDESFPSNTTASQMGNKWQFRFINDLSNTYTQQHPWVSDQEYGFDSSPQYGNNDAAYGYDPISNRLEGTNHIEYFTNTQIGNGTAAARGFVTCPDEAGFTRANCPPGQIGGFMITNSSGVTYHYALPAYSSNEWVHTEIINTQPNGFTSTDLNKSTPYAYTWYLTAITGPDYVSRGATVGLIDPSDWGYWVKFEYGKWVNNYTWNTPSQGLTPDIDGQFQTYSSGKKELYYLDAIVTRTHTAIFEKEIREDGLDVKSFNSGFGPIQGDCGGQTYTGSTLRLNNIYLFKNDQLPISIVSIRNSGTLYQQMNPLSYVLNGSDQQNNHPQTISCTVQPVNGQNVIDKYDITPQLAANCLRKISFNYDYSLCSGVPNNIHDLGELNLYFGQNTAVNNPPYGKLTLLSVDFQGQGGTPIIPPIQFQYDLDANNPANQGNITITNTLTNQVGAIQGPSFAQNPSNGAGGYIQPPEIQTKVINQSGAITVQTPGNFNIGDILSFQIGGTIYYCTLLSSIPNVPNGFNVLFLNNSPPTTSINTTVAAVKTKNPPYNYDAYDNWQYYKSDYLADPANTYLSRFNTPVSNASTDVWSLRKIVSSVGANININYKGNSFNRSVLNNVPSISVTSPQINMDGTMDMTAFGPALSTLSLSQFFKIGGAVTGPLAFYRVGTTHSGTTQGYNLIDLSAYPQTTIISVIGNVIKVKLDPNLNVFLSKAPISQVSLSSPAVNDLVAGNLCPNTSSNINYGGGICVNNITVDDLNGNVQKTAYDYSSFGNPGSTSGVTSYLPGILSQDNVPNALNSVFANTSYKLSSADQQIFMNQYHSILYRPASYLMAVSRVVPAPGVLYETVAVNDYSILSNGTSVPVEGTTLYQYEVFKPEMVGLEEYYYKAPYQIATPNVYYNSDGSSYYYSNSPSHLKVVLNSARDVSIKDYTSRVGNLKRVVTYDNYGNKLTEKINHYLNDDLDNTSFQNQVIKFEPRLATYNNGFNNVNNVNNYNGVSYNDMGVIKERYGTARASVDPGHVTSTVSNLEYDEMLVMSNRETFPTFLTSTTQIDYKNGTSMSQTNLAYDFYTGAITQTLTTDSYGNRFISVATPAYMAGYSVGGIPTLTYPALGLKTHDDDPGATQHKQMLSQQASNYTFSVDVNNIKVGVVTASVQTWANDTNVLDPDGNLLVSDMNTNGQLGIWRMKASYKWTPSGSSANNVAPYSSFTDYFLPPGQLSAGGASNPSWKKTAQITQYNVYSAALEAKDINNNFAATRMGHSNSKVLITGGPAQYNEIAYSGAEDAKLSNGYFSNQVSPMNGAVVSDTTNSHTGTKSLLVAARSQGFMYNLISPGNKSYSVSVWVKPTASNVNQASLYYQVNGGTAVTPAQSYSKTAAGWYLLEMTVPASAITGGNLMVGCTNYSPNPLYFDDFRFQPTAALATAYVYDTVTGELTYILGNNNLYTRFQYDAIGRLVRTYKEVLGKSNIPLIKAVNYNYARGN
ncbi:MAG: hypothetical protein JWP37_976 [Mucilaginibacter sp.]|nr:hypothetical protein [Mucilaginibacter sp.]